MMMELVKLLLAINLPRYETKVVSIIRIPLTPVQNLQLINMTCSIH